MNNLLYYKVFNLKGKVVPLTEDNVTLMAEMKDKTIVEGEKEISLSPKKIKKVFYKEAPVITPEAIKVIKNAELTQFLVSYFASFYGSATQF